MKKIIISLIACLFISFSAFASPSHNAFSAIVTINSTETIANNEVNSNVSIGFKSSESFNEFNFEELNADGLKCDVSVTVSVGVVSVTVTAKDIDCSQVGATIKRLKALALKQIDPQ